MRHFLPNSGETFKQLREGLGLSQNDLAMHFSCTNRTISRLETTQNLDPVYAYAIFGLAQTLFPSRGVVVAKVEATKTVTKNAPIITLEDRIRAQETSRLLRKRIRAELEASAKAGDKPIPPPLGDTEIRYSPTADIEAAQTTLLYAFQRAQKILEDHGWAALYDFVGDFARGTKHPLCAKWVAHIHTNGTLPPLADHPEFYGPQTAPPTAHTGISS